MSEQLFPRRCDGCGSTKNLARVKKHGIEFVMCAGCRARHAAEPVPDGAA